LGRTNCNEEISRKNNIRDFQRENFITGSEIEEKFKNDREDGLTCFASQKGSKRDLIVGKMKSVDTKIIFKIYKAVKSCDIFDIPFGCLLFEILESEGKQGQYPSIFMGPIYGEMQRQHTYHILA